MKASAAGAQCAVRAGLERRTATASSCRAGRDPAGSQAAKLRLPAGPRAPALPTGGCTIMALPACGAARGAPVTLRMQLRPAT